MNTIHHSAGSLPRIGDLLTKSVSFYKKHFKQLFFIGLVPVSVSIFSGLVSVEQGFIFGTILSFILVFILAIAGFVIQVIAPVAFIRMIKETEEGKSILTSDVYAYGLKLFWPMVWIYILMWTAVMGGTFLLIIPGIALSIYLLFPMYSFVISGHRGLHALSDSFHYVRGHFWAILGRLVVLGLIIMALHIVVVVLGILAYLIVGGSLSLSGLINLGVYLGTNPSSTLIPSFVFNLLNWCLVTPIMIYYTYSMLKSLHAFKPIPHAHVEFAKTRPWLITFSVIGVVVVLGLITVGFLTGFEEAKQPPSPASMEALQRSLDKINLP